MQQHQQREYSSREVQWQGVRRDVSAGIFHIVIQQRVPPMGISRGGGGEGRRRDELSLELQMTNHLTLPVSHTVEGEPYTIPVRGWQAKGRTSRPRTTTSPYCLPLKGRERGRFWSQLWVLLLLLLLERERYGQGDDPGRSVSLAV